MIVIQEDTSKKDIYIGDFHKGNMNGYGIYVFANGNRYEGQWVDNKKCGHGLWISQLGDSYRGEYQVCMYNIMNSK